MTPRETPCTMVGMEINREGTRRDRPFMRTTYRAADSEARWAHAVGRLVELFQAGTLSLDEAASVLGVNPLTMRELVREKGRRAA